MSFISLKEQINNFIRNNDDKVPGLTDQNPETLNDLIKNAILYYGTKKGRFSNKECMQKLEALHKNIQNQDKVNYWRLVHCFLPNDKGSAALVSLDTKASASARVYVYLIGIATRMTFGDHQFTDHEMAEILHRLHKIDMLEDIEWIFTLSKVQNSGEGRENIAKLLSVLELLKHCGCDNKQVVETLKDPEMLNFVYDILYKNVVRAAHEDKPLSEIPLAKENYKTIEKILYELPKELPAPLRNNAKNILENLSKIFNGPGTNIIGGTYLQGKDGSQYKLELSIRNYAYAAKNIDDPVKLQAAMNEVQVHHIVEMYGDTIDYANAEMYSGSGKQKTTPSQIIKDHRISVPQAFYETQECRNPNEAFKTNKVHLSAGIQKYSFKNLLETSIKDYDPTYKKVKEPCVQALCNYEKELKNGAFPIQLKKLALCFLDNNVPKDRRSASGNIFENLIPQAVRYYFASKGQQLDLDLPKTRDIANLFRAKYSQGHHSLTDQSVSEILENIKSQYGLKSLPESLAPLSSRVSDSPLGGGRQKQPTDSDNDPAAKPKPDHPIRP